MRYSRDRMVAWKQQPRQSVPITIKVVSSNLAHGEVYLIQHDVIKFVIQQTCFLSIASDILW